MYEEFYRLKAEPFRLSPDHKFCFGHKGFQKARAYMAYAFRRAEGFVMITGRPGTGKTTLIGELVEGLAHEGVTAANLVCTQLEADDLLKTVAYSFGVGSSGVDKAELLQRITVLLNRWHREKRRPGSSQRSRPSCDRRRLRRRGVARSHRSCSRCSRRW